MFRVLIFETSPIELANSTLNFVKSVFKHSSKHQKDPRSFERGAF